MTTEQQIAKTIVETAFEQMAAKIGVTIDEVKEIIKADKSAMSHFAQLIEFAQQNIGRIMA